MANALDVRKRGLLIILIISIALFLTIILQHDKLKPIDLAVNNAAIAFGLEYYLFFQIVSFFGSIYFIPFLVVLCCIVLWMRKKKREALWLAAAAVTSHVIVNIIKELTNWSRPSEVNYLIEQTFPSGHASTPFVVYMLAYLFLVNKHKRWHVVGIVLLVVFIASSRIFLNKHWLSDILGGLLLAVVWISGVLLCYKK